jgi:SAM-dependent methyltransferase
MIHDPNLTPLTSCVACGSTDLRPYLDLGRHPLANTYPETPGRPLDRHPLGLSVCGTCGHSQQHYAVSPDLMYTDYAYVSGTSQTLRDYFRWFRGKVEADFTDKHGPPTGLRVLEIACNDGSLLQEFHDSGHAAIGVDPAKNLTAMVSGRRIPVKTGYWNIGTQATLCGPYHAIIAMNVLGHVADPVQFLTLARMSLAQGGRLYIQTSQAEMIANGEFDTVYHEHVSFFTARSLRRVGEAAGLTLARLTQVPVHGTSYLAEFTVGGEPDMALEKAEHEAGYYDRAVYDGFGQAAHDRTRTFIAAIRSHVDKKFRVVGYGAAAKAMTLLNYAAAIDGQPLPIQYIVDENPLKQGRYTPGTLIPIERPVRLTSEHEKLLVIVFAWNFRAEIVKKVKALRPPTARDTVFLSAFPKMTLGAE